MSILDKVLELPAKVGPAIGLLGGVASVVVLIVNWSASSATVNTTIGQLVEQVRDLATTRNQQAASIGRLDQEVGILQTNQSHGVADVRELKDEIGIISKEIGTIHDQIAMIETQIGSVDRKANLAIAQASQPAPTATEACLELAHEAATGVRDNMQSSDVRPEAIRQMRELGCPAGR